MSRYVINKEDGSEIAYGFDHALGYFIQKFETDEDGEDVVTLDLDRLNSSRGDVLAKMIDFGVPHEHVEATALDLPF